MIRIFTKWCLCCALLVLTQVCCGSGKKTLPAGKTGAAVLHYRPEGGVKAGDVIPFYWNGEYHLFYMKTSCWSHLVSRDLVHWEELPDALVNGTDPMGPDFEGIWTGSVVEHDGEFYLFYTGKNMQDPRGDQKVMQARSTDLVHWTKRPEYTFYADGEIYWSKPVNGPADDKQIYHHQAFRDPNVVWNAEKNEWWMTLHALHADGSFPTVGLYTSKNLIDWTPQQPLITYPASVSGDCPEQFWQNGMWNVICADYHYMRIREPGAKDPEVYSYDCGDLRVPKSMYDGKRRVLVGWIGDYKGAADAGEYEWGGGLSMPRELYLDEENRLCQRPLPEIIGLFDRKVVKQRRVALDEPVEVPLNYMLTATLAGAKPEAVLNFRQSAQQPEAYRLTVNFETREIGIGSAHKSFKRVCGFDPARPVDIRLFVDGTVAECFVNDAYCFTMRIYDCQGGLVSFGSDDPALNVERLEVYEQVAQ